MSQKKQVTLTSMMSGMANPSNTTPSERTSRHRRPLGEQSTPNIINRKRKAQSPAMSQETPQKRRTPLSVLAVTPDSGNSIKSYLVAGCGKRPRAMPASLSWGNSDEIWAKMVADNYPLDMKKILSNNPQFRPQMRAILLDWLIEVCEVYNMHRDTYYLAMDLFDRYLSATDDIPKQQLQLVGVTCLFISGKMEEIYPPQINEYSYVSDGACEDVEIIAKEMGILTKINWNICRMTSNNWLTLLLQLSHLPDDATQSERTAILAAAANSQEKSILLPDVNLQEFNICAQLLDLCSLDMESLNFKPLHLAAAVVYHVLGPAEMERVTGLRLMDIEDCIDWVLPFAKTLRQESPSKQGGYAELNKQVHNVNLSLLEKAQNQRAELRAANLTKTPTSSKKRLLPSSYMTPPSCSKLKDENRRA